MRQHLKDLERCVREFAPALLPVDAEPLDGAAPGEP
jgi:hypothetical protein